MKPIHLNSIYTITSSPFCYDGLDVTRIAISDSIGAISIEYIDESGTDRVMHLDQEESLDLLDTFVMCEGLTYEIKHI